MALPGRPWKFVTFLIFAHGPQQYGYFRFPSFSWSELFDACSDLSPPRGPKKTRSVILSPPWAPLGPLTALQGLLGGRLGRRTRFRDPLGTCQKPLGAKNEIVNISWVLPSKFEPWRTLADPGPPKKAPHGLNQLFGGPPRRLQGRSPENTKAPGRPLGRQTLVSEPSLAPPRNYKDANYKKT